MPQYARKNSLNRNDHMATLEEQAHELGNKNKKLRAKAVKVIETMASHNSAGIGKAAELCVRGFFKGNQLKDYTNLAYDKAVKVLEKLADYTVEEAQKKLFLSDSEEELSEEEEVDDMDMDIDDGGAGLRQAYGGPAFLPPNELMKR